MLDRLSNNSFRIAIGVYIGRIPLIIPSVNYLNNRRNELEL